MNRDHPPHRLVRSRPPPPPSSSLSRSPSNVSWGTKIKGAIQVTHGLTDAIRGSLGATDPGPHEYASSGQIAQRGRHEMAQGLARIRGVTAQLPPAPVYDRRHSYPTQQYEEPQRIWSRRSSSAHHRRDNPPTASSPFEKYYDHPYPIQQDHDPGFAGLGAGIDPARRKEGNDRIVPAFLVHPPQPASSSETPYPSQTPYTTRARPPHISPQYQDYSLPRSHQSSSLVGIPSVIPPPTPPRSSIHSAPPHTSLHPSSAVDPYYGSTGNANLSVPSPIQHAFDSSSNGPPISEPSPSTSRHSLPAFMDRTKSTGKGKGKEGQPRRRGRIRSMFLGHSATRPSSPDHDVTADPLDPSREHARHHQTRSAPATPPPHRHESVLEHAGYDVLSYDAKDVYPHWPTEEETRRAQGSRSRGPNGARLEPVRSMRA